MEIEKKTLDWIYEKGNFTRKELEEALKLDNGQKEKIWYFLKNPLTNEPLIRPLDDPLKDYIFRLKRSSQKNHGNPAPF